MWNVQSPARNLHMEQGNPGRRSHTWVQTQQEGEPTRWKVLPRQLARPEESSLEVVGERLSPGSSEFEMVEGLLNSSVGSHGHKYGLVAGCDPHGFRATAILRVQNSELWDDYSRNKQKIMKKHGRDIPSLEGSEYLKEKPMKTPMLDLAANEHWLFHGTDWRTSAILCTQGYDTRVAATSGMFGAGFYLAEDFSKSNQYIACPMCKRNAIFTSKELCECQLVQPELQLEGDKLEYSMLVYRACLGDPHIALKYDSQTYRGTKQKPVRRPPQKGDLKESPLYDCVVGESMENGGDKLKYREIIFYERASAFAQHSLFASAFVADRGVASQWPIQSIWSHSQE